MQNRILSVIGFIVLGAIAVVLVYFGMQYFEFANTAGDFPVETALTQVGIANLSNGAEVELGHPLLIEGYAAGPKAFLSLELWIDGQLASVQSAYSLGNNPFETSFSWLPDSLGAHSLVLRAIDEAQQTTNSNPVIVFVTEQDARETNDVGAFTTEEDVPVVFPSGGSSYVIPAPSGDEGVGDATDWSASVGGWAASNTDLPPMTPELAVTAGQCSASLYVHDLSDNELGFKLQRYSPSFDQWVDVATLNAQSQYDWLMYTDSGISGALQYQVVAFNQTGNAASNVVVVNIDPADCPEIKAELAVVDIALHSLSSQFPMDMAYCYRSYDGGFGWERWPASDFFYPDEDGNLDVVVESSWQFNVIGEPIVHAFDLFLDCWGWGGEGLSKLGSYEFAEIDPLAGGFYPMGSGDSSLTIGVWPGNQLEQIVFYPLDDYEGQLEYAESLPDSFDSVLSGIPPEEREMPGIILDVTQNAARCEDHLPSENQNLFGRILFCFPYPGFDAEEGGGDAGVNPQSYLVWSFDLNGCMEAIYDPSVCKSYAYYLAQAELTGGQVGFWINDSASQNQHGQNAAGFTQFVIPPLSCLSQQRTFSVQMWYKPGPKTFDLEISPGVDIGPGNVFTSIDEEIQGISMELAPENSVLSKLFFVGPLSNEVTIPCPKPLGDNVQVEITYKIMELSNIDDGDEDVKELEIYGFFLADMHSTLSGGDRYLNIATWQEQHEDCPDDTGVSGEFEQDIYGNAIDGCPHVVFPGSYGIWELYACDSSHRENCALELRNPTRTSFTEFEVGNNKLRVDIGDGDSLDLFVEFWDYDEASGDDLVCVGHVKLDARNIFEWSKVDESSVFFAPNQGSGNCSISFDVQAVP